LTVCELRLRLGRFLSFAPANATKIIRWRGQAPTGQATTGQATTGDVCARSAAELAEKTRLAALDRYKIIGTPPETVFDRFARLAQSLLASPYVAISFIEAERIWVKAAIGANVGFCMRGESLCEKLLVVPKSLEMADVTTDIRHGAAPPSPWPQDARAFFGTPIITPDEQRIGALSVMCQTSRRYSSDDRRSLIDLAALITDQLELRLATREDPLTGAMSAKQFADAFEQDIARAKRHGGHISLLAVDVDRFRAINDRVGRTAADRILVALVDRMRGAMRLSDRIGRLGGKRFYIALPETHLERAKSAAQRVLNTVFEHAFKTARGDVRLTVSIGIAALSSNADRYQDIVDRAEAAMFEAKNTGRNVAVVQSESIIR
jgi:diguanylate cyclase (GGDEF)-like protein